MSKKPEKSDKNTQKAPGGWTSYAPAALVAVAIAALAVGAVWLSSDGEQAGDLTRRPFVGGDLHSLAVDPANPDKVMVGGHEGAAMSEDGGKTWRQVSDLEGTDPMGWVIDPDDPSKMYVGGHPGFYRSEDGGESFSQDNSGLPGTDVHGLGMDPQNPKTLYAYISQEGLYRSEDAGGSWELVNAEFGAMGPILVDPRNPDTLYLAGMDGGFRRSGDGGESWQEVGNIPDEMVMSSVQDQSAPDTFYAAGGGVAKSTDGGESWEQINEGLPGGVSAVAVASSNSRVVYAGVLEGDTASVYRSEDGGESWEARNK